MPRITTYLTYADHAEEAANYYVGIFPSSRIDSVHRYGKVGQGEVEVVVVEFELDGQRFVALNGGPLFTFTDGISLEVEGASQYEVDYYWERLGDGGTGAMLKMGKFDIAALERAYDGD